MNCEQVRDEIPAIALGVLDAEEARLVLDHLRGCEGCTRELRSALLLRDTLNFRSPASRLPNGFTERLIARTRPTSIRGRTRASDRFGYVSWPLVAAAVLLIALLGLNLHSVSGELAWQRSSNAQISALMSRSNVMPVAMQGYSMGARGRLYVSHDWNSGVLMLGNLPSLPDGNVYQLWLVGDGATRSIATFTPSEENSMHFYLNPPYGLKSYKAIEITIEPKEGSPHPTGKRVLASWLDRIRCEGNSSAC